MKKELAPIMSIVGPDHVSTDRELLIEFSNDLVDWNSEIMVDAVVRPADAAEISAILKYAVGAGLKVSPRGAGLSYTKGYAPESDGTIALDLSRMNQITELNERDLYLVAGAGTTWQQVHDAAKAKRLRPVISGPISGSASTLGGAVSQNIIGSLAGV
ncbi:MAG: FAD-binding oxidoreductase, partial [Pseudorhodoplanes sp.]